MIEYLAKSKIFISFALVLAVSGAALAAETQETEYAKYRAIEAQSPSDLRGLDAGQRQRLFNHVVNHEVVSPSHIDEFEPYPGDASRALGYCFGRAMAVHLFARSMGVRSDSIRKLFIVGDLRQRGATVREWGFHVTTLIKDAATDQWYAVDPIMQPYTGGRSQTARQWIDKVREVWDSWRPDRRPRAKLYLTSNSAIIPEARDDQNRIWDFDNFTPQLPTHSFGTSRHQAYVVDMPFQDRHFAGSDEPGDAAFPLLGIWLTVNTETGREWFGYNRYFVRLLDSVIETGGDIPSEYDGQLFFGLPGASLRLPTGNELGNGGRLKEQGGLSGALVPQFRTGRP